ncbi:YhcH/YjgK/YiaL family protein [Mycoplasma leonicaptivi]|uniref:YhcH/YjgK/YiaL family protein n=1 Tax=Mycoplasma leonicaptivi TaxID=36742 RepID=UPI0004807D6F|nr:YhcH/YjgK/YiaL family protein [Mycoplasma leonicaptivi]
MVFDYIHNIPKYKSEYPQLNKAMELMKDFNFKKLDFGVLEIDENIRIIKRKYSEIEEFQNLQWGEVHKEHIDIHIYGGQSEEIFRVNLKPFSVMNDVLWSDEKNDVMFMTSSRSNSYIHLKKDTFAIFFPGELHCPIIKNKKKKEITKIIIKIKV